MDFFLQVLQLKMFFLVIFSYEVEIFEVMTVWVFLCELFCTAYLFLQSTLSHATSEE